MKTKLIAVCILLASCRQDPFTGYVVGKEYEAGHFCCSENHKKVLQSVVIPPRPVVNSHHHTWQKSRFTVFVANHEFVYSYNVDSISYQKYVLGKKVTMRFKE
jgi:hypothetical protein